MWIGGVVPGVVLRCRQREVDKSEPYTVERAPDPRHVEGILMPVQQNVMNAGQRIEVPGRRRARGVVLDDAPPDLAQEVVVDRAGIQAGDDARSALTSRRASLL